MFRLASRLSATAKAAASLTGTRLPIVRLPHRASGFSTQWSVPACSMSSPAASGSVAVDGTLVDQAVAAGVGQCWAVNAVYQLSKEAGPDKSVALDDVVRKAAALEFEGQVLQPPIAEQRPHEVVFGAVEGENRGEKPFAQQRRRTDNYFWLRDDERKDPKVLRHLELENAYMRQQTKHLEK